MTSGLGCRGRFWSGANRSGTAEMDPAAREKADLLTNSTSIPIPTRNPGGIAARAAIRLVYIDDEHAVTLPVFHRGSAAALHQQKAGLPARIADAPLDKVNHNLYQPQYRERARRIFEYVKQFLPRNSDPVPTRNSC